MSGPSVEVFATATAVANLVAAVLTANEGRKKAKEGGGLLKAMEDHTSRTVREINGSIDHLSETVERLERSITKESKMFNDRFKKAQSQFTLVLEVLLRDRRRDI